MTFLAFWPSLGSILSKTSALFSINLLTFKKCENIHSNSTFLNITNSTQIVVGGDKECELLFDPFYPLTGVLLVYGVVWVLISNRYFKRLQALPKEDWKINLENKNI
ncbi:acetyl-coenzyme A transporter 1 [Brachionus plicatilis]|uniref:Acetyl-coenzyme A transporter 1 n=1 Tax=Brachionus plicatilis TaxID=10195 RepID=A0A3M7S6B1_BRAPC|nr:acetyl-coenzyme A transporter 1 [Brachionus plicatilis]